MIILKENKVIHMVIFNLKYAAGTPEAQKFLEDGKATLSKIPVVRNFKVFTQISPKNDYDYGFSMEFDNSAAYEEYNHHELHVGFVQERWIKEVTRFLEIDFNERNLYV